MFVLVSGALAVLAALAPASLGQRGCDLPPVLRLDHVPVAVADLEAAGARYRALGFVLKPGREHANGLTNLHAKFPDGTELELITASAAVDELTSWYIDFLSAGDGPAFLSLYAGPLGPLSRRLAAADVPHRADPGALFFATDHPYRHVFFGVMNHSPTDRPEHFAHANTAVALDAVWVAGPDHEAEVELLGLLGASPCGQIELPGARGPVRVVPLREGSLYLAPGSTQSVPGRRIVGVTVRVADLDAASDALARAGLATPVRAHVRGRSLLVAPDAAFGLWLELLEPSRATMRR